MKNVRHYFALFLSLLILNSCEQKKEEVEKENNSVGLKDAFKEDFLIGVALNASQIEEQDSVQNKLISTEFNSVTPENIMKSLLIHPNKDTYNFDLPDKLVALAEKMICIFKDILWFGIVNYHRFLRRYQTAQQWLKL